MCKWVCGNKFKKQWIRNLTSGNFPLELQSYSVKLLSTRVSFANIQINALILHVSIKLHFFFLSFPLFFEIFPLQIMISTSLQSNSFWSLPSSNAIEHRAVFGEIEVFAFLIPWKDPGTYFFCYHKTMLTELSKWEDRGSQHHWEQVADALHTWFWEIAWLFCINEDNDLCCWLA